MLRDHAQPIRTGVDVRQWQPVLDGADRRRHRGIALAHHATDSNVSIRLCLYLAESHTDPKRAIAVLETLPSTNVEALNGLHVA